MSSWGYSAAEKAACAKREAAKRRAVYPNVRAMTSSTAKREIDLMEAIAADYQNFAALDPGLPLLDDKKRLVLFFATDADRDEFLRIYREAKPDAATLKV